MTEYHAEIIRGLQLKARDLGLQVPSPSFIESGATIVDYVSMRSLLCEFPVPPVAASVDGSAQFGWLAGLIDHTGGLLAFLASGMPCVPVSMNLQCIRPMNVNLGPVSVEAKLRNRTRSLVFIEAKATSGEHRTIATAAITLTVGSSARES
ncbi:MAG: hypothetical protein RLZZ303_1636 [Candidatus Hydrogenedentota bacterium]|jgi:acyl-coenzyme A thioesterase PaaI-like protein